MDTGLLVLRIVVGLLLVGHGAQKLFGWFGGGGLNGTAWFFRSVGYRPPRLMAGLAGGTELVGGVALAAGFMTPLAASAAIGTMLNASVAVHRRNGLWAVDNGYEYPLVVASTAVTLSFTGAGATSLDARLGLGGPSIESGLFAVALGLVAGSAVLLSRAAVRSAAGQASKSRPSKQVATPQESAELRISQRGAVGRRRDRHGRQRDDGRPAALPTARRRPWRNLDTTVGDRIEASTLVRRAGGASEKGGARLR